MNDYASGPFSLTPYGNTNENSTSKSIVPATIYKSRGKIVKGGAVLAMPTIGTGQIVPYLLGRRLNANALLLWYGNIQVYYNDEKTQTTEQTPDGGTIVTTNHVYTAKGYKADFQLGLALGPGVALRKIYYKEKVVWEGNVSGSRTEFTLPTNASPIRECIFRSGAIDQTQEPYLEEMANESGNTPTPGYVGIAYLIIKKVNVDELGSMAFEVERFPNPLGISGGVNQSDGDINIISAIADIITNEWGGCGQNIAKIDTANFIAAAARIPASVNGCSLINNSLVSGVDLLKILTYQCRGYLVVNPETNKYQIRFVNIPITGTGDNWFFDSDINDVSNMSKPAWLVVPPNVSLEYTSRLLDYASLPVIAKNPNSRDGVNSTTSISMPTVMKKEVAATLLAREMAFLTTPAQSVTLTLNRNASDILPGEIATLVMAKYKYSSVPMIVEKRRVHPIDSELVTLVGTIYPYSNLIALYGPPEDGFFESFDPNPYPPIRVLLKDLPFAFNYGPYVTNPYRKFTNPDGSYPYIYAQAANKNQMGYYPNKGNTGATLTPAYPLPVNIWRDMRGGGLASYTDPAYPLFGKLASSLSKYTAWTGGRITLSLTDVVTNKTDAVVAKASGFILIDDELFMFDPISMGSVLTFDRKLKTLSITNVARCMIDSVAADHDAAAEAFFLDFNSSAPGDTKEININRLADPVASGAHLPYDLRTYGQSMVFGLRKYSAPDGFFNVAASSYTASDRYKLPYRPHNTKINDVRQSSAISIARGASITVSWKPRPRLSYPLTDAGGLSSAYQTQLANYYEQTADVTTLRLPEIGSDGYTNKYHVWIKDSGGTTIDCGYTTPSDTLASSFTFTVPSMATGPGTLWVNAEFLQAGTLQVSKYKDAVAIVVT